MEYLHRRLRRQTLTPRRVVGDLKWSLVEGIPKISVATELGVEASGKWDVVMNNFD